MARTSLAHVRRWATTPTGHRTLAAYAITKGKAAHDHPAEAFEATLINAIVASRGPFSPPANHIHAWPFQYHDAPVPAGLGDHPGGGPPGAVLRFEGKQITMTRPNRPSRAPSNSPTLIGMFFKWAIRALAAGKNSHMTMIGANAMA